MQLIGNVGFEPALVSVVDVVGAEKYLRLLDVCALANMQLDFFAYRSTAHALL